MKKYSTNHKFSGTFHHQTGQKRSLECSCLFGFILIILLSQSLQGQDPNLPPSGNFELIDWKVTLPDQSEVKEQALSSGFESPNEFYTDPITGAMVFRCPNNGATGGSTYPRSELREMLRAGNTSISTSGIGLNNWVFSTSSQSNQNASGGVDGTLTATVAVDHVSTSGNSSMIGRVIIGQIHAASDEPCRLYYRKLPGNNKGSIYLAHEPGNGNSEQWYDMIGSRSSSASDPADGIALGEQFSYEIKVEGNTMTVTIMRPGKSDVQEIVDMSNSGFANDWMYFKAGCYNQNNSGDSGDYAQVSIFALSNTHSTTNNNAPSTSITSPSNGASFTAGNNITINANASDSDGSVTKVEFFQGATKLGEDTSSPYSYAWNNVSTGGYNLTTVATDDQGATNTSSAVSITVSSGSSSTSNVALNKPVTVSSEQANNPGSNLVDDNPDSRWSASGFPQWTEIDLGATHSITSTEVVCFSDRAYQYIIEASTNGSSYSTIVDRSGNSTPGTNTSPITDNFSSVDARYVRITVSGAASYSGSWVSLEELRVFGEEAGSNLSVTGVSITPSSVSVEEGNTQQLSSTIIPSNATDQGVSYSSSNTSVATVNSSGLVSTVAEGTATITVTTDDGGFTDTSSITVNAPSTGTNLALNKPVTGTGTPDGTNVEANLVDGDPDSRWSVSGFPKSVTVDLGALFSIESTEVICYNDRAYQYIIEASTNGSSYSTIVDRSSSSTPGTNASPITDSFSPVDARYIRITVSGAASYSGSWVSLEELRVFGEEAGTNVSVTGVSVSPSSTSLNVGNTQQLSSTISPSNATDQGVTYISSNSSIATVNSSGLVTAVSEGNATITVTTVDGGFTDTSVITVESGGGGNWTVISSEDFESGWGIWNDGGSDAKRYTGGTHAHQGSDALNIENDSGSSVVTTDNLSLAQYTDLKVDFWFKPVGMDNGHDFWLQVSTDGGSNYTTFQSWTIDGSNYANDSFYQESVELLAYGLNDQIRLRFRCDGNDDGNDVYLDEIVISVKGSSSARIANTEEAQESELEQETFQTGISKIYPNPVRDKLFVEYELAKDSHVAISIFNMSGQVVTELINNNKEVGKYKLEWNTLSTSGKQLPVGIYVIRFDLGNGYNFKRIILE